MNINKLWQKKNHFNSDMVFFFFLHKIYLLMQCVREGQGHMKVYQTLWKNTHLKVGLIF